MRREFRPLLRLAVPIVLGELGWMAMGIADSMMVGRLGAAPMSAVSVAGILFFTVTVFGMGILLGLDTLVSQAWGAGKPDDARKSLINGLWLTIPLSVLLMAMQRTAIPFLAWLEVNPVIFEIAVPYSNAVSWSTFPLLVYAALRRYLQGTGRVRPVMFSLISANLVNLAGNYALIFGKFGMPAMGAEGAAWATLISRVYMASVLLYAAWPLRGPWTFDAARIRAIVSIGLPASIQLCLEVGVFGLATALVAKLDPSQAAAHQIALSAASVSFMIPLGLGSAAAVRVGQSIGAREFESAGKAGWAAITLGTAFMAVAGVTFVAVPGWIGRAFTSDASVIRAAAPLLAWCALFQLFDGAQGVAVGALRGAGETRLPAAAHGIGYWLIGLPLGYWLCFSAGWGAGGLWAGLSVALILIGVVLTVAWSRKTAALSHDAFLRPGPEHVA